MYRDTFLRLLNVNRLITGRVIKALERREQIDDLQAWHDSFSPFPMLNEIAEAQLQHAVEYEARSQMTQQEYTAFRQQWCQIDSAQQRRFLCQLAGLPDPERDRDFEA